MLTLAQQLNVKICTRSALKFPADFLFLRNKRARTARIRIETIVRDVEGGGSHAIATDDGRR